MTPHRPAPARPGSRPGARRGARGAGRSPRSETTAPRRSPESAASPTGASSRPTGAQRPDEPEHPSTVLRLGGADGMAVPVRILVLVVVLLLGFVVVLPSLRGYLSQRAQYDAVVQRVAEAKATATALEDELARWQDDEYVRSQARERLSYVMPGETTYVVIGAEQFEDSQAGGTAGTAGAERPPWFQVLRESTRVAGGPSQAQEPATDPAQQGWSTSVPTVPTASPVPSDAATEPGASGTP